MNYKNKMKLSFGENVFDLFNYIFLFLFTLLCAYPFWYVMANSFASQSDIAKGVFLFPRYPKITTYAELFKRDDIPGAFWISVSRTVISTVLCIIFTSMFAYLMTQKDMPARKFVYRYAIVTMYVGGGLIPWYLVMKAYHLDNSFLLYVVPAFVNVFFTILIKTYMESLPPSLEESAAIDGAGFFTIFFKIIFPLSKPIVATIAIYQAVGAWNSYFDNYLLVTNPKLQTMQLILFNYLNQAQALANMMKSALRENRTVVPPEMSITTETVRNAITVISTVPIFLVYPFLQKYFVKGIMMGSIKG